MAKPPATPTARKAPATSTPGSTRTPKNQQQRKKATPKSSSVASQPEKTPHAIQASPNDGIINHSWAGSPAAPPKQIVSIFGSPKTLPKRKDRNEDLSLPNTSPTSSFGLDTPFTPKSPPSKKPRTNPDNGMQLPLTIDPTLLTKHNFTLTMPSNHGPPMTQAYLLPGFSSPTPMQAQLPAHAQAHTQAQAQAQHQLQTPFNPAAVAQHPIHAQAPRSSPMQVPQPMLQQQQHHQHQNQQLQQQAHSQQQRQELDGSQLLADAWRRVHNNNPALLPEPGTRILSTHIDQITYDMWQFAFSHGALMQLACQQAAMGPSVKLVALAKMNYLPSWWWMREIVLKLFTWEQQQTGRQWVHDDTTMMGLWKEACDWASKSLHAKNATMAAARRAGMAPGGGTGGMSVAMGNVGVAEGNTGGSVHGNVNGGMNHMGTGEERKADG